jgi:hypothetical protein
MKFSLVDFSKIVMLRKEPPEKEEDGPAPDIDPSSLAERQEA